MKKIFLIICILLLLTSCDVKYEINMNKNEKINDKLSITEKYDNYNKNKIKEYDSFIKDRISTVNLEEEYDEDRAYYDALFKKNYNSLKEYANDYYIKKYIGNITNDCNKTCELRLTFTEDFKNKIYGNIIQSQINNLEIKLDFPFTIIETNAEVNKKTLTWNITENNKIDYIYVKYKNYTINDNNKQIFYILTILGTIIFILILFSVIIKKQKKSVI